jgi:hypothetical protein
VLVAAAVCPHPPLLVRGTGVGADGELEPLRAHCGEAVRALLDSGADLVVVLGESESVSPYPEGSWGTLRPYGLPLDVGAPAGGTGGGAGTPATLPLPLTVGRWLLEEATAGDGSPATLLFGVGREPDADRSRALGAALADRAPRVAMLVLGDGSARRSEKGPGHLDPRAEPYDAAVAAALAGADAAALLALDQGAAAELLVAGLPAWQVLAGAALATGTGWTGRLLHDAAPYGVCYLVATWTPVAG